MTVTVPVNVYAMEITFKKYITIICILIGTDPYKTSAPRQDQSCLSATILQYHLARPHVQNLADIHNSVVFHGGTSTRARIYKYQQHKISKPNINNHYCHPATTLPPACSHQRISPLKPPTPTHPSHTTTPPQALQSHDNITKVEHTQLDSVHATPA